MKLLRQFLFEDQGQDLIEYTLLLGFISLASAALFLDAGQGVHGIWTRTNSQLSRATSSISPRTRN